MFQWQAVGAYPIVGGCPSLGHDRMPMTLWQCDGQIVATEAHHCQNQAKNLSHAGERRRTGLSIFPHLMRLRTLNKLYRVLTREW